MLEKLKYSYRGLAGRKHYIEVITALLSIPMLLSVIVINFTNLSNKNKPTPTPTIQTITVLPQQAKADTTVARASTPTPMPTTAECQKTIGPVEITSPTEGTTVNDDPLTINISYPKLGTYCAVVWSYRINGGSWSDFTDTAISIYNLPAGDKKLELKVKSIVSTEEKILTRNFTYKNSTSPTPSPTTTVTPTP